MVVNTSKKASADINETCNAANAILQRKRKGLGLVLEL